MRVVSLLPSATEIVAALGALDTLVGRSHECDWPDAVRDRPALTRARTSATTSGAIDEEVRAALETDASLYELDVDALARLAPDVILTQDLCRVCSIDLASVRAVAATMVPAPMVLALDPHSVHDVIEDVLRVGNAIGRETDAEAAVVRLRDRYWTAVDYVNPYVDGPAVAFLEWLDPLFVAGHWTPELVENAGARHPLNAPGTPSHEITVDELVTSDPDRIVVGPCGWSLDRAAAALAEVESTDWWPSLRAVREGQVVLVDGNAHFSRPGPRLVEAYRWLVGWINERPELIPPGFPVRRAGGAPARRT